MYIKTRDKEKETAQHQRRKAPFFSHQKIFTTNRTLPIAIYSFKMKFPICLSLISFFTSQALACIHFQGNIQVGGVNHGISINKFEGNGKKPCHGHGPTTKESDGWFKSDANQEQRFWSAQMAKRSSTHMARHISSGTRPLNSLREKNLGLAMIEGVFVSMWGSGMIGMLRCIARSVRYP